MAWSENQELLWYLKGAVRVEEARRKGFFSFAVLKTLYVAALLSCSNSKTCFGGEPRH